MAKRERKRKVSRTAPQNWKHREARFEPMSAARGCSDVDPYSSSEEWRAMARGSESSDGEEGWIPLAPWIESGWETKEEERELKKKKKTPLSNYGVLDGSVLPSLGGHVAVRILWGGHDRGVLNCHSRKKALKMLQPWKLTDEKAQNYVNNSGLTHLKTCMFEHLDMPLLCAFVERWQPDTNTFHLPVGEMTIMLHDVFYILRLPVDGRVADSIPIQVIEMSVFLEASLTSKYPLDQEDPASEAYWICDGLLLNDIRQRCSRANATPEQQAQGYLAYVLGSTLFVDNSTDRMSWQLFSLLRDVDRVSEYAWGAAALAYLYRQLGIASRADAVEICGCLTLLQAWIYEYFPIFRQTSYKKGGMPSTHPRADLWYIHEKDKDLDSLKVYRVQLDQLTSKQVNWLPYGRDPAATIPRTTFTGFLRCQEIIEPYHPDRVLRQLGYIQVVPTHPSLPELGFRSSRHSSIPRLYKIEFPRSYTNSMWLNWRLHRLHLSDYEVATDPSTVTADYMDWYYRVSQPFLKAGNASSYLWMRELVKRLRPALDLPKEQRHEKVKDLFAALDDVGELMQNWCNASGCPTEALSSFPPTSTK